jgi:broad specificity phosphatase PhoE
MNEHKEPRQKPCFIIVRHGESITNVHRDLHKRVSDPSVWLTEKGHGQARLAGDAVASFLFENDVERVRVMRSTYLRAQQTSNHIIEAVSKLSPNITIDTKDLERFRELEFGYAGTKDLPAYVHEYANLLRFQRHKYFATRYGGESPAHMENRVRFGIDAIYRDFYENEIDYFIIVCHGLTMRVLIKTIMDYSVSWYEDEPNPGNCSVRILDNGIDLGYKFPRENGQWEADWSEAPEDFSKLNPHNQFFSVEEMNELIAMQAAWPEVMQTITRRIQAEPAITATELMGVVRKRALSRL